MLDEHLSAVRAAYVADTGEPSNVSAALDDIRQSVSDASAWREWQEDIGAGLRSGGVPTISDAEIIAHLERSREAAESDATKARGGK